MRWLNNMNETIKRGIRSWLNVVPASGNCIQINVSWTLRLMPSGIVSGTVVMVTSWSRCTSRPQSTLTNTSSGPAGVHQAWRCVRYILDFRG